MLLPLALAAVAGLPADLAAVGTIVGPRPDRCVAILHGDGRTRVVAVGDTAFGARVAAIRAGVVTLESDGDRIELRLGRAEAMPPPPPLADAGPDAGPAARELSRQEVERRLGQEMPRIMAETTLVPALSGGRVAGFTLTRVPANTVLSEAGLQAGDVLTSINGVEIDSMGTLVGLYGRLQNESALHAVVLRNGQPVSLTLHLR